MDFSLKSSEKIGLYRLKDVLKLCLKQLLPTHSVMTVGGQGQCRGGGNREQAMGPKHALL